MRYLKPIKKTKTIEGIKNNFFVFDVETTKLEPMPENFVFGVIYGYGYKKIFYEVDSFKNEFKKRKYKNKYIFAHNAEFDLLTLFGNIYTQLDTKAIFNGKFISAKYNNITFADSLNIYPASVAKIGNIIGLEKFENEKIKSEGLKKFNVSLEDIEYCTRDCEIIYKALLKIFEEIGTIKITLASLSMFNFRNKFLNNVLSFSNLVDKFYYSYYGGRTEVFKMGKCTGKAYDINSLYPFAMSNMKFPDIRTLKHYTKIDLKYFKYLLNNYEGMAKLTIFHKKSFFGFIPYKNEKLLFPIGKFETTINFNEIRFALEYDMIEIISIDYVVCSLPIDTIFKPFVDYHYNKRLKANEELTVFIHKLILNSLYGRFAMRIKYQTEYYDFIPYEIINELQQLQKFHLLKTFSELRNDCYLITENEKFKNSFYSIPVFSSYITSQARIILLKGLLDNEQNKVLYCDTDSIFLEGEFNGIINNKLGNWKLEEKEVIEIKGLKNYVYIENNEVHETIKGISKNAIKINDNTYIIHKYYKTKEALRRNVEAGKSYEMSKTLSYDYTKRLLLSNGNTQAINL